MYLPITITLYIQYNCKVPLILISINLLSDVNTVCLCVWENAVVRALDTLPVPWAFYVTHHPGCASYYCKGYTVYRLYTACELTIHDPWASYSYRQCLGCPVLSVKLRSMLLSLTLFSSCVQYCSVVLREFLSGVQRHSHWLANQSDWLIIFSMNCPSW